METSENVRLVAPHLANSSSVLPPKGITLAFDADGLSVESVDRETADVVLTVPGFSLYTPEPTEPDKPKKGKAASQEA